MGRDGTLLIPVYVTYGIVSVALTIWLARTLFRSGAVFLEDVFAERRELADAINRLLVVGFYMLNLGYALLILRANQAGTPLEAAELLITKLGILLASLGVIHFVNVAAFMRIRRRNTPELAPVAPHAQVNPGYPPPGQPWAPQQT